MGLNAETWTFQLHGQSADRVYLVKDCDGSFSTWLEMTQTEPGIWEVTTTLTPGQYRLWYFTAEGDTFLNGGNFGLHGRRLAGANPEVVVDMPETDVYAQPA